MVAPRRKERNNARLLLARTCDSAALRESWTPWAGNFFDYLTGGDDLTKIPLVIRPFSPRLYKSFITYLQGVSAMKTLIGTVAAVFGLAFLLSSAFANPALLPKHEGYPMKNDGSPVNGQPTANDPGQSNQTGEKALLDAADVDKHVVQTLSDENNQRISEKQGAGQLPKVQGPQIMIQPPVTSATKIGTDRVIP
jgi:hypothetical protein